jgi:hypothetical protein
MNAEGLMDVTDCVGYFEQLTAALKGGALVLDGKDKRE